MKRLTLLVACLLVPVLHAMASSTILDYPATAATPLTPPQSVFHAADGIDQEAAAIIKAWQTDAVSMPWTRLQLGRHIKHKISPTRAARGLALVHVAMYDAWALAQEQQRDPKLAVSMAAAQVLSYLFIAEEKTFERIAYSIAAQRCQCKLETLPPEARAALQLGQQVGLRVVQYGDTDGAQKGWNGLRLQWYGEGRYYGPGSWEPTPPYFYYPPDEPFALNWRTWTLQSGAQFRPEPPLFGSPEYIADLQEVISVNQNLSAEQLKTAKFWVDGSGTVTPAGHWNQIALDRVREAKLDEATVVRLFAQLNMAEADTFIAAWDAKYTYWTVRPITAAKQILGLDFKPALLTPPFPSFVSGHAAFSGAAARILGAYLPQQAAQLDALAEEAANSRLLAGIHFRHDNAAGLALGRKVAQQVLQKFDEK